MNSRKQSMESRFIDVTQITPGDIWFSCDGAGIKVVVESVDIDRQEVYYSWQEDGEKVTHSKSGWSFQVRYYKPGYSELEPVDRTVCQHFHDPRNCWQCEDGQKQQLKHIVILGKKGVTADMEFICTDCNEKIHGGRILDGEYLYIVERNPSATAQSRFRCECCQDDFDDKERE